MDRTRMRRKSRVECVVKGRRRAEGNGSEYYLKGQLSDRRSDLPFEGPPSLIPARKFLVYFFLVNIFGG